MTEQKGTLRFFTRVPDFNTDSLTMHRLHERGQIVHLILLTQRFKLRVTPDHAGSSFILIENG